MLWLIVIACLLIYYSNNRRNSDPPQIQGQSRQRFRREAGSAEQQSESCSDPVLRCKSMQSTDKICVSR